MILFWLGWVLLIVGLAGIPLGMDPNIITGLFVLTFVLWLFALAGGRHD